MMYAIENTSTKGFLVVIPFVRKITSIVGYDIADKQFQVVLINVITFHINPIPGELSKFASPSIFCLTL